ncbi:MAG: hypothetical protein HFE74_05905 [Firmicutes bacterium]|jgi:putative membrane protein|nr:hypothetical protein [Bacillota bacterium]
MIKKHSKLLILILCLSLIGGGVITVYAVESNSKDNNPKEAKSTSSIENEEELAKDETVYVFTDSDGKVQKIIVSDWLKDSFGTDTYSQNDIQKELPVDIDVSYKLDGKAVSSGDLAGKSGKVTIRFDYKNNQYNTVSVGGKQEQIYVPFTMLTGIIVDNDIFSNVTVSNGKIINDGNRTVIIGMAFPGLQKNLDISASKLEIPNYIEITADVKNFQMTNTMTIATNEIFNEINTSDLNSLDDLSSSINELSEAMERLMNGSSKLYDGICTLLSKSGELVSGIDKLSEGAAKLKDGAENLDLGAAQIYSGTKDLAGGLDTLVQNNEALNQGSKDVFNSLLNMADAQLSASGIKVPKLTIENYSDILNNLIASLDENNVAAQAQEAARKEVTTAVNAQRDDVKNAVTMSVRAEVKKQILASMGLSESTGSTDPMVEAAVEQQMQTEQIKSMIEAKTNEQIDALIEQNMNSAQVQAKITAALESAKSGAAKISALKQQLDSYNDFYVGLNQYTAGVASAKAGADKLNKGAADLKSGTSQLNVGMEELYNGINTMKDSSPALIDGITSLKDGSLTLSDGLKEFNEKGIEKLVDAVNGNIKPLIDRLKATVDVSKCYKTFDGLTKNNDSNVKFIYRTEAIKPN